MTVKTRLYAEKRRVKAKNREKVAKSADEYLEQGGLLEERGDRWANDPTKARRFYNQALEAYRQSLSVSALFDALYAIARLDIHIAQGESVNTEDKWALIQDSVTVGEQAILLEDDKDAMFNLAQAHIIQGEGLANTIETYNGLQRAIQLLERCGVLQEQSFNQTCSDNQNLFSDQEATEDCQWARIVEPETYSTQLDTQLALFSAMKAILQHSHTPWKQIANMCEQIQPLADKCAALGEKASRIEEVNLNVALLQIHFLEAQYNHLHGDLQPLANAVGKLTMLPPSFDRFCEQADVMRNLAEQYQLIGAYDQAWNTYTNAQEMLTSACVINQSIASVYVGRGDIEMSRAMVPCLLSKTNRSQLLKNAIVYYRNAQKVNLQCFEAHVKEQIASAELEGIHKLSNDHSPSIRQVIIDAVQEGLIDKIWLHG